MKIEALKTEESISYVKKIFAKELLKTMELIQISSPIMVLDDSGINDNLNGVERTVTFSVKFLKGEKAVIVNSLAKWKRLRLKQFEVEIGKGILTDMRAIRPDEDYSSIHSIYVDQWDWEKRIDKSQRNLKYLKEEVRKIYQVIRKTEQKVAVQYSEIQSYLPEKITFFHTEELCRKFSLFTPKERERIVCEKYGAVFLIGIGKKLSDGQEHDGRAPDYDDWSTKNEDGYYGLNGDILIWNPVIKSVFELSSMGIRVDAETLIKQLKIREVEERKKLPFHKLLLNDELPLSIGGGIGQSRICMYMLRKMHIGQVQVSLWPEPMVSELSEMGISLL
ncbi:MAG: aspartate--ammonia ligase [Bacteroidetes bacterium]|nr:aspartate--ammonia ligase [Bacteroidota bacterium]